MRRPRTYILASAVLFACSSLVVVFATGVRDDAHEARIVRAQVLLVDLAGQDADGNGIRDDVDAFIVRSYGQDGAMRGAAEMIARSIQPALAVDLAQVQDTSALAEREVEVMSCVSDALGPERRGDVEQMINRVTDKTYDTSARFEKREAFRRHAERADFSKPARCDAQQQRVLSASI